ncbi:MAG: hypothetical protein FJY95_16210 [Candidatus Handelsmanbacteria bacterium]|nr:hypothetical protein [Candidatus Handelsmanbacteria bacterium]
MYLAGSLALLLCWTGSARGADSLLVRSAEVRYLEGGSLPRWLAAVPGEEGAAPERPSRLERGLWWSAGLALAAGGAAWWSARQADRAYERYLHSAGQGRQEETLRRSRRYDRVAGAAFACMEAGIVLSLYLVFF